MPVLQNQRWELFCRGIARGEANHLAYSHAFKDRIEQPDRLSTVRRNTSNSSSANRLLKIELIRKRIDEIKTEINDAITRIDIADKDWRVRTLDDLAKSLLKVMDDRKKDPVFSKMLGGSTGTQVGRVRIMSVPKDPNDPSKGNTNRAIFEAETDIALTSELRATLLQAGRELGQLSDDRKGAGSPSAQSQDRLNELYDVWAAGPKDYVPPAEKTEADAAEAKTEPAVVPEPA